MAEIKRSDLVEDGVIMAPLELSKNMQTLVAQLDKYNKAAKGIISTSDQEAKSLVKLGDESKKVAKLNQDFAKTQDQLAKQVQVSNEQLKQQQMQTNEAAKSTTKYTNEMVALKKELKAAQSELVTLAKTTGTNSKEFQAAAIKAGKLKDEINDIGDAVKNTSSTPFENMAKQLGSVGSKLASMDFEGALDASRQFAATSKLITFKEAFGGIKQVGQTLLNVGKALLTNPLFLLGALFAGIAIGVYKLRDSIKPLKIAFDFVGESLDYVIQKGKDFLDWLGLTTFALDEQAKKEKEATEARIKGTSDFYDQQVKLAEIAGKETESIEKKKWQEIKRIANEGFKATVDSNGNIRKDDLEDAKKFLIEEGKATYELELIAAKEKILLEQRRRIALIASSKKHLEDTKLILKSGVEDEEGIHALSFHALEKHLAKMLEATQVTYAQIQKARYDDLVSMEQNVSNALEIERELAGGIGNIIDSVTQRRLQAYELERIALDARYKEDIAQAGNNADAKFYVEKNYQDSLAELRKKELVEKQRMARFDKAAALVDAGIKEAQLILRALLLAGTPFGSVATAAAIAGGLQVAAIAAKPIPKYEKGTKSSAEGLAMINEKGRELLVGPDGKARMYDTDGAMLTTLKAGTKVYTAEETDAILNSGLRSTSNHSVGGKQRSNPLLGEIQGLRHDIRTKKSVEINISRAGIEMAIRKAEYKIKFLDDFYA
jgi:hypothetical protein